MASAMFSCLIGKLLPISWNVVIKIQYPMLLLLLYEEELWLSTVVACLL